MSSFDKRKPSGKRRQRRGPLPSKRKTKSKMTCSFPDSLSDESSLNENYLDNYSTESDYSDSKAHEPDDFSSGEELNDKANGRYTRLFVKENDEEELSIGAESSEERMNKYFSELRKSNPPSPDSDSAPKSKAKGDFALPDFFMRKLTSKPNPGEQASTSSSSVRLPDPKCAPEAVLRLRNMEDLVKNRKVIDYINQLEASENDVNRRLAANVKVPAKEIETLHKARDAILKQFGYDFSDKAETERNERRARRRLMKKNEFPSGVSVSSSSESQDSERLLKEEITRRVLQTGSKKVAELDFADLVKHSPRWKACVEDEMYNDGFNGKIENLTKLTDKLFKKKNKL